MSGNDSSSAANTMNTKMQPTSSLSTTIDAESTASMDGAQSAICEEPQESARIQQLLYLLEKCLEASKNKVDCHEVVRRCYGASIEIFNADGNGNPDSGVDMIAQLMKSKLSEINQRVMNDFREELDDMGLNTKLLHLESRLATYARKRNDREESEQLQRAKSMKICEAANQGSLSKSGVSVEDIVKREVYEVKKEELLLLKQELTHCGDEIALLDDDIGQLKQGMESQLEDFQPVNEGMSSAADPATITA